MAQAHWPAITRSRSAFVLIKRILVQACVDVHVHCMNSFRSSHKQHRGKKIYHSVHVGELDIPNYELQAFRSSRKNRPKKYLALQLLLVVLVRRLIRVFD